MFKIGDRVIYNEIDIRTGERTAASGVECEVIDVDDVITLRKVQIRAVDHTDVTAWFHNLGSNYIINNPDPDVTAWINAMPAITDLPRSETGQLKFEARRLVIELRKGARVASDRMQQSGFECKCSDLLSWKSADMIERLIK